MSSYPYSSNYFPAAPVVEISLGAPGAEPTLESLEAIVDAGADATMIPISYLKQIGAKKVDQAMLRSQWGERRPVSLYAVAIGLNGHCFTAMCVVGDEIGDEVVLGRNVLNRLRLLLDGPTAMTKVMDEIA